MGFSLKTGVWKTLLKMLLPMIELAGESYRNQDDNDTGKDDLIGYSLIYLADLGKAILSGDENKIRAQLNKTPKTDGEMESKNITKGKVQ